METSFNGNNLKEYMEKNEMFFDPEDCQIIINEIVNQLNTYTRMKNSNEDNIYELLNILVNKQPCCWVDEIHFAVLRYYTMLLDEKINFNRGHIPYCLLYQEDKLIQANRKFAKKLINNVKETPLNECETNDIKEENKELWKDYKLI